MQHEQMSLHEFRTHIARIYMTLQEQNTEEFAGRSTIIVYQFRIECRRCGADVLNGVHDWKTLTEMQLPEHKYGCTLELLSKRVLSEAVFTKSEFASPKEGYEGPCVHYYYELPNAALPKQYSIEERKAA